MSEPVYVAYNLIYNSHNPMLNSFVRQICMSVKVVPVITMLDGEIFINTCGNPYYILDIPLKIPHIFNEFMLYWQSDSCCGVTLL